MILERSNGPSVGKLIFYKNRRDTKCNSIHPYNKKILLFVKLKNIEDIMLNEISQAERKKLMFSLNIE